MKKVLIILGVTLGVVFAIAAIYFVVLWYSIPKPYPRTEIDYARDGGTWVSVSLDEDRITGRKIFKEAFMVTEEGEFRWLKMEVRLNGELVGEEPEAGVTIRNRNDRIWKYPSPGVHDLCMGDWIQIESVGRPIRADDRIVVLYDNNLLASIVVVGLPED